MTRNAPADPSAKPGVFLACPDRNEFVPEVEIAVFVENQQILALAVLRTADQRDVALTSGDARQRNPRRVDARSFLAHESARRSRNAVHDGNVAGQQIRQLRQKERRAQIVHQPLIKKPGSGVAFRCHVQNVAVDREIALAAAGGDNHVIRPRISLSPLTPAEASASPAA